MEAKFIIVKDGKELIFCCHTFEVYLKCKWNIRKSTGYLVGRGGMPTVRGKRQNNDYFHKFLSSYGLSPVKGMHIDHINRNPLDNRLSNLRLVTVSQNCRNRSLRKDSTTKLLGVSKMRNYIKKPFRAYIYQNNKHIHLGYYTTAEEAAKARDAAIIERGMNFSLLNFPETISCP